MAQSKTESKASEGDVLVEVKLDRPFTTNGIVIGYEIDDKPVGLVVGDPIPRGKQAVFTGKALVSEEVAEDLTRRQDEYRAYEASLHNDRGKDIGNLN